MRPQRVGILRLGAHMRLLRLEDAGCNFGEPFIERAGEYVVCNPQRLIESERSAADVIRRIWREASKETKK